MCSSVSLTVTSARNIQDRWLVIGSTVLLYCAVLYCIVLYSTTTNPSRILLRMSSNRSESNRYPTYTVRYDTTTFCLRGKIKTRKKPNTGIDRIVLLNGIVNRSIIQTHFCGIPETEPMRQRIDNSIMFSNFFLSATERRRTVKFVEI